MATDLKCKSGGRYSGGKQLPCGEPVEIWQSKAFDAAPDVPMCSECVEYCGDGRRMYKIRSVTVKADTKPTNPKDACGIAKAPMMSVIPQPVMAEVAVGLMEGARKYGRHNYRKTGVRASVYADATTRHLAAWWEGENTDPASGVSHISKAIASLIVLRDSMIRGNMVDDRPPKYDPVWMERANAGAADVIEKYPTAVPPCTEVPCE